MKASLWTAVTALASSAAAAAARQLDMSVGQFPTSWTLTNITVYAAKPGSPTLSYFDMDFADDFNGTLRACCMYITLPDAPALPASPVDIGCSDARVDIEYDVGYFGDTMRVTRYYYDANGTYTMTVFGHALLNASAVDVGCGLLTHQNRLVVDATSAIA